MNQATRIPAAQKRPEDFDPPAMPAVVKKLVQIVVTRKSGEVESTTMILRPGDIATIDGKTVAEG